MAGIFDLPEFGSGLVKLVRTLTDRGILIRTGVAFAGIVMIVLGLVLLFREPIQAGATTALKAV
jgi:uncharacterized membrane protein HdeD (DUF308 family)